jgi:ribose transport system substrate-binding protein
VKIAVSLPDEDNEYQLLQADDARATAARLDLEIEVRHARSNPVQQIQQIFKFIHAPEPPAAIVVEPVGCEGLETAARSAARAGIAWVVLNAVPGYLAGVRSQFPDCPAFVVGSDQMEIGRLQGRQIRALLPAGGSVLFIQGPQGVPAARERFRGLDDCLAGSQFQLTVLDGRWTEESAETAVRSWLRMRGPSAPDIDLVAAQDDSMARGARRAFECAAAPARWSEVPLLGIDGVPGVGQRLVDEGQLAGTVIMPSNTGPAIERIAAWLESGELPPAQVRVPVRSYPEEGELQRRHGGASSGSFRPDPQFPPRA